MFIKTIWNVALIRFPIAGEFLLRADHVCVFPAKTLPGPHRVTLRKLGNGREAQETVSSCPLL